MRMTGTRAFAVLFFGILLFAVAFVSTRAHEAPREAKDRLASLLQSFMDVPSQSTADELIRSLDNQEASPEQGNEILAVLTAPRALVRSAYSVDKPATYMLTYPARLHFRNKMLRCTGKRFVNGVKYDGGTGGGSYGQERIGGIMPDSVVVAEQLKSLPQTVMIVDEQTVEIFLEADKGGEQLPAIYSCTSRVHIPIRFVSEQAAESVHTFTSPDLDARMQSAFYTMQVPWACDNSRLRTQVSGTINICYRTLPTDIAFKKMFRDKEDRLLEIFDNTRQGLFTGYAGTSRKTFGFHSLNNDLKEFPLAKGKHEGHLVLIPSPEGAYYDPRLVNIWGGTLEFPMTLVVDDSK